MRERERVERERDKRGRSRALSPKHKHHGYLHRVDQASISFFVTNFPTEVASENLWETFARFGRVGDVYIPNKVDKWGRRFGFVKFMEVRDEEALNRRLQEVWFNTFKLRVNRSRFIGTRRGGRMTTISTIPIKLNCSLEGREKDVFNKADHFVRLCLKQKGVRRRRKRWKREKRT
jgi:RNA recognition motif-containing protein